MFKHLLIPTDGSEFSTASALKALDFAKSLGADVTAVTVTAPWRTIAIGEVAAVLSEKDYEQRTESNARQFLQQISDAAKAVGVRCSTKHVRASQAYAALIEVAEKAGCDLIVMGSHGYRGLDRLLLGSETVRTLTHTKIPVLVLKG